MAALSVPVVMRARAVLWNCAAPAACAALMVACGASPRPAARLSDASFPYLGIRCQVANWAGCDRVGIGVHLARRAVRVTVTVDGHMVRLSPPTDPGSDLWEGLLLGMGPRHGALAVRTQDGYWSGTPEVYARVRVTAYFAGGARSTLAGTAPLHPGYG